MTEQRPCACGCGGYPKKPTSKYLKNHDKRVPKGTPQPCACGCGGMTSGSSDPRRANRYISGHNARVTHPFQGRQHSSATRERLAAYRGQESSNYKHGWSKTPTYKSWAAMHGRCYDKRNASYPSYGARGITVCARWSDFIAFLEDMGERPSLDHSIDRIEVDGNYEPANCRWLTRAEQNARRRDPGGWIRRRANQQQRELTPSRFPR